MSRIPQPTMNHDINWLYFINSIKNRFCRSQMQDLHPRAKLFNIYVKKRSGKCLQNFCTEKSSAMDINIGMSYVSIIYILPKTWFAGVCFSVGCRVGLSDELFLNN